jgi:NitT/TauT family transport system ATP-binding protein
MPMGSASIVARVAMPTPSRELAVSMRGIRRVFVERDRPVVVLDGVDLAVERGSFVALVGPSGCGKSTLLRLIARLDRPDAGAIDVSAKEIAYVFQDAHLLPWRTVAANVELPLELRGVARDERRAAVVEALAAVDLADAADRHPAQLSGGMRMRASIARALVTRPKLLLMDEPFAALDEITRNRLDESLRALCVAQGLTVVFVTHAIFEAAFLADRVIVLSRRPGRVVADLPVDLAEPRTSAIRATPAFARIAGDVLRELERGALER